MCLTGCDNATWTARVGVASRGGTYHHYTSLSECQKKCSEEPTCIAVDVSAVVCIVHTNISDIDTRYNAPGYTQYRLNRKCQTSTAKSTSSTTKTTSPHLGNSRRPQEFYICSGNNQGVGVFNSRDFSVWFLQRVSIACYAERCISYSKSVRLTVRLSVRLSVCPSHAGTESKRLKLRSWGLHWRIAPWL